MESLTYVILFIMGIFFGSFCTLAVHRIPRGEDILYQHSYCPKCQHKLGVLDLIPVLSYLGLRGKCRYCHETVRIRYLLLEVLSGLTLVLYGYVTKFQILFANMHTYIMMSFMILYLVGLFILAGIDKEKKEIQPSVLWYQIFLIIAYMIYICTFNVENAYIYVIYLSVLTLFILLDVILLRKYAKPNYGIRIIILLIGMLMFTNIKIMLMTIGLSCLYGIILLCKTKIEQNLHKWKQKDRMEQKEHAIAFVICVFHIISILVIYFIENDMLLIHN